MTANFTRWLTLIAGLATFLLVLMEGCEAPYQCLTIADYTTELEVCYDGTLHSITIDPEEGES